MTSSTVIRSLYEQIAKDYRVSTTILFSVFVLSLALFKQRVPDLPAINQYPGDWFRQRALKEHKERCISLIKQGFKKFGGPFRLITPFGSKVVLPSSYTDWVKQNKDLSHQAYVADEFYSDVPGFEGQAVVSDPGGVMIRIVKAKLSTNAESISIMSDALDDGLKRVWTDSEEWHTLDWVPDTMKLIYQMSSAVFVGPRLSNNEEWQQLSMDYVRNFFASVFWLVQFPRAFASLARWFSPTIKACASNLRDMRVLLANEIDQRRKDAETGAGDVRVRDSIDWVAEDARGRYVDHAAFQAAFAIAAMHTTTEALRQVLLDICLHPKLLEPLREEISNVLNGPGLALAGLQKLHLLDSVMKESQRFSSASVGLERQATRDTKLPNGVLIPKATNLGVDASDMWNPEIHTSPDTFDGYRFMRMREDSGTKAGTAAYVASTKEHNTFGAGKYICPGRFFAGNEIKVALVKILMNYDIRIAPGHSTKGTRFAVYWVTDQEARVEVRRRTSGYL